MRTIKTLLAAVFLVLATTVGTAAPSHALSPQTGGPEDHCGASYKQITKVALKDKYGNSVPGYGYLAVYRSGQGTGNTACALTLCGSYNCGVDKTMMTQSGLHGDGSSTIYWQPPKFGHYQYAGPSYATVSAGSCAAAAGYVSHSTMGMQTAQITTSFCR